MIRTVRPPNEQPQTFRWTCWKRSCGALLEADRADGKQGFEQGYDQRDQSYHYLEFFCPHCRTSKRFTIEP